MEKYTMTIVNEECEVLETKVYRVFTDESEDEINDFIQDNDCGFDEVILEEEVFRNQDDSALYEAIARDLTEKRVQRELEENDG